MFSISLLYNDIVKLYVNKNDAIHLKERSSRIKLYDDYKLLSDNFISCFKVDKDHVNGLELHAINENGLLYIYNFKSRKLITILHARSEQLKRYYNALGLPIPQKVYNIIKEVEKRNKLYSLNNV
jgi:hypothetical protein